MASTYKPLAISTALLAGAVGLYAAWKTGSDGARNLLLVLLWARCVMVVALMCSPKLIDATPPLTGAAAAYRTACIWCWFGLAGAMVWHGHFVLAGVVALTLFAGAAIRLHVNKKWEASHG